MTEFFIIIGVILLLLLFLYFGFKYNLNIEKFTNTDNNKPLIEKIIKEDKEDKNKEYFVGENNTNTDPNRSVPTVPPLFADDNIINLLAVIKTYSPICYFYPKREFITFSSQSQDLYSYSNLSNLINPTNSSTTRYAIIANSNVDNKIQIETNNSGNVRVNLDESGRVKSNYSYIGNSNITYLSGTIDTDIEFINIPEKFTLCSITKYNNSSSNQNTILTSTLSKAENTNNYYNNNLWFHGHNNGHRGVVCYNNFLTENADNIKDNYLLNSNSKLNWVVTCAKNNPSTSVNNVIVNGIPIGNSRNGGIGGNNNKLSINKYVSRTMNLEKSDYAFSYIIMWNSWLSDRCLKYVSDALIYYLNSGTELLYDYTALTSEQKSIIIEKSNEIKIADNFDLQTQQIQQLYLNQIKELQELQNSYNTTNTNLISGNSADSTNKDVVYRNIYNLPSNKNLTDDYTSDFYNIINKLNENTENQNMYQERIINLLSSNLIKKEPDTSSDTSVLTIDKILNNIAYLDNQLSVKNPYNLISENRDVKTVKSPISYNNSRICPLLDKMPEPTELSFTTRYENNDPSPESTNKNDQSYLWCKCSRDNYNTDMCKAFNVCRINYDNNNKDGKTSSFSSISEIDKNIYNNCTNAFPNFPKYLG